MLRVSLVAVLLLPMPMFAQGKKKLEGLPPDRYAEEWKRTKPDLVVYKPQGEFIQGENQHFLVTQLPSGRIMAVWTQSTRENHDDQKVVVSFSDDDARTWTAPYKIDGAGPNDPPGTGLASWGFPLLIPKSKRIVVFYNKNIGIQDTRADTTGVLRGRYSDDEGKTWSTPFDLPIAPCALSHPDRKVPASWIVYQAPILAGDGVPLVGFTHWGSAGKFGKKGLFEMDSEIRFLRFDDVAHADPTKWTVSTWPKGDHGLRVPRADLPKVSVVQEPSIVPLPDGRLFCVMRTLNGTMAWSQSKDHGKTWDDAKVLLTRDGGTVLHQPIAPCPIYPLEDGRFLLVFHNNDGKANGGNSVTDYQKNRYPAYVALGTFAPGAIQPVEFGTPVVLMSSDGVILGPSRRSEVATYTSFFRRKGRYILWYPDRKHFLLGRYLDVATLFPGPAKKE